jgi:DNA-directed RNA polymerase subunit RPC12/RpoP
MDSMKCLRCSEDLKYAGTKKLHEGSRLAPFFLDQIGELFVNREKFDVYFCPRCGHVEWFVDGVGEELRPE